MLLGKFHCFGWPNIEQIIYPSGHTGHCTQSVFGVDVDGVKVVAECIVVATIVVQTPVKRCPRGLKNRQQQKQGTMLQNVFYNT